MPLVTAALAPVITAMKVIDTYEVQRSSLSAMTGIFGFLLLGWIFYIRRTIALGSMKKGYRWIMNLSPFALIVLSIVCFVGYTHLLDVSLDEAKKPNGSGTRSQLLKSTGQDSHVPHSESLILLYLATFLSAEGAFVMMALREYTIDVLKLSEYDWIFADQDGSKSPVELKNKIESGAVRMPRDAGQ
jgi:energy-coupling factor transporter transmembrane protein EcfT